MKVTQISVFLENRKGRLFEVCSLMGNNEINILALTIAETEDFGILRMIVDKPEDALSLLKKNGFMATLTDVVVVEIEDVPGGLAKVLGILNIEALNIEYMHAFLGRATAKAYMVFRFDDPDTAIAALQKNGIRVIRKGDILNV